MPRFQILHFPSPEMTRFFKKCKRKLKIFQKFKFEKIDNSLTSFFLQTSFLTLQKWWKILSNQNRLKFEFSFKDFKFSFPFFAKTGHFWTWKYQNLESRHQNCQPPSFLTLKNERLSSLQILTFWALKLIFWSKFHKILSKMYISS